MILVNENLSGEFEPNYRNSVEDPWHVNKADNLAFDAMCVAIENPFASGSRPQKTNDKLKCGIL